LSANSVLCLRVRPFCSSLSSACLIFSVPPSHLSLFPLLLTLLPLLLLYRPRIRMSWGKVGQTSRDLVSRVRRVHPRLPPRIYAGDNCGAYSHMPTCIFLRLRTRQASRGRKPLSYPGLLKHLALLSRPGGFERYRTSRGLFRRPSGACSGYPPFMRH
jgi:hypothetical protein